MVNLIMGRDEHSIPNRGYNLSDVGSAATLAINTDTTLAVPDGMSVAVIQVPYDEFVLVSKSLIDTSGLGAAFTSADFDIVNGFGRVLTDLENDDVLHFYAFTADVPVKVSFYRN